MQAFVESIRIVGFIVIGLFLVFMVIRFIEE